MSSKYPLIRRPEFDHELARIMVVIARALLEMSANKLDVRAAMIQYNTHLVTHFEEVLRCDLLVHVYHLIDGYPSRRNTITLTDPLEIGSMASAMKTISGVLDHLNYSHEERQRVAEMLQSLLGSWLKADDGLVQRIYHVIVPDEE